MGLTTPFHPRANIFRLTGFLRAAAKALGRVAQYARWRNTPLGVIPDYEGLEIERARDLVRRKAAAGGGWLLPKDIDDVLKAFGLPVAAGKVVKTSDEAAKVADTYGYPVVIKLASDKIVHKSDWDGVKVNLKDADAVRAACEGITQRVKDANRLGDLEGFLVQPMIEGGVELVVGMTDDPLFGPLMVFGLGGIYVEVLRDVVFRITPLTDKDVEEMVTGIKGYKLFARLSRYARGGCICGERLTA